MKIFSVSDIHGNLKELEIIFNNTIKEELDSNQKSKLILLGDYINRVDEYNVSNINKDVLYFLKEL